ncbi:MspA family porin [Mycolicibacterium sp. P9-64]|uniref:MspA family porin n=1 Tax=Mycolicibacterium sp. P9-64 TaxID=2024612 RepID=UPI001F5C067A|nr:MspA family porin [Mycolicibacterium sp. P9-64]
MGTALLTGTATAHAGMDSQKKVFDRSGHALTIEQWDVSLDGVSPMDRNRLTREWFHSGRAIYSISGEGAESFSGTLELGYQIGFPWSLGVATNLTYTTPNTYAWEAPVYAPQRAVVTPNLLPAATISVDIGNGPGIQEVATFSVSVTGPAGTVAVANAHGTVSGAAGGVQLRPYARLIWPDHATVTTYGEQWNMN